MASSVRVEEAWTNVRYYPLGQFDVNKKLDSLVTRRDTAMDIYGQIREHFLKMTDTSMMSLIVKLVSSSKLDSNHKCCSRGINDLRNLKQKIVQRCMKLLEILHMAAFLMMMMMEPESVIEDKIMLMENECYESIAMEEVVFMYASHARDLEFSKQTENKSTEKCEDQ